MSITHDQAGDTDTPDIYGAVHADPDLSLPPHREPAGAVHWLLRAIGVAS